MYVCIHVCMYVCMHACMYVYMCVDPQIDHKSMPKSIQNPFQIDLNSLPNRLQIDPKPSQNRI